MIKSNQKFLAAGLLALVVGIAAHVFAHFSPGALSPDSLAILAQARSGILEDAHPPLMAVIWRILEYITPGPLGILVLNLALFYGGLFLIYFWGMPRYGFSILPAVLIAGLFPPIVGILGAIWIDITMAAFFLAAVGVNLVAHDCSRRTIRILACAAALAFIFLGTAIRHNGAAAALPLACLILLQSVFVGPRIWNRIASAAATALIMIVVFFIASKQISAQLIDVKRHFWRVAALYDITGASYHEKANLFSDNITEKNTLDDIYKLYSPRSVTPLLIGEQVHAVAGMTMEKGNRFEFSEKNPNLDRELLANWVDVIVHHPKAYLKHRSDVFASLVTRSPWGLWAPVFDVVYPNYFGIAERPVVDSAYFAQVKLLALKSIIFVPVVYLILCAAALIPTFAVGLRFQNGALLVAAALYASGLAHMVGLFFLAASADFRYSHWTITASVVATVLVLLELLRAIKFGSSNAIGAAGISRIAH